MYVIVVDEWMQVMGWQVYLVIVVVVQQDLIGFVVVDGLQVFVGQGDIYDEIGYGVFCLNEL